MKGYTDITTIENYILQTIDPSFYSQINAWIEGIEQTIDNITGRSFVIDEEAEPTARLYDGDCTDELLIDDCVSVETVEVGNDYYGQSFTEVPDTGAGRYFTYPVNHAARGIPITKIRLSDREFPHGSQNNKITALWGYSVAVPKDIKFAATVFVAGIINQSRQGGDSIKSEKIGNYQVTYNSDNGDDSFGDFKQAMSIVQKYVKYTI